MKSLIGKHNLNNALSINSIFLKKLKKSELQEGDIIITNEENTTNIYMVVLASEINYAQIDLTSIENDFVFIQRDRSTAAYLAPSDYNDDLEYLSDGDEYQIKYVFHSNYLTKDVLTKNDLLTVLNKVKNSIKESYPSISRIIEIQ